jgi:methyl acetate hydrolase
MGLYAAGASVRSTFTKIDGTSVDEVLQAALDGGAVPHVAATVADAYGIVYEGGAGPRIAGEEPETVTTSTQFAVISMTKMVCTAVALQQVERGELELDAPVERYCRGFGELEVLEGFDGDMPRTRPPASKATVRQLVTHTSGLAYGFWNADIAKWKQVVGASGSVDHFSAPMVADPGTEWVYGTSTDWLGKVVEVVAGKGLNEVVREDVSGPLGMDDTMFRLDDLRLDKAVRVHTKGESGRWASTGLMLDQAPDWWSGGHGLYSTPRDFIRFERALLRGGELDGTRILQESTVDAAFSNQIGDLDVPAEIPTTDRDAADSFLPGPGWKWGYGLLLNTEDLPGRRRAWTGAWAGFFNTHFFVDRTTGICASIYTNSLPFVSRDEAWRLYGDFEQALYASL